MKKIFLILISVLACQVAMAQTARVKGLAINEEDEVLSDVVVRVNQNSTATNENGFYQLNVPAEEEITVAFSHPYYQKVEIKLRLDRNEDYELNIRMHNSAEQLQELVIDNSSDDVADGKVIIDPNVIRRIPGANEGVENLLKTLPGVNANNELSTGYNVRGGNFDENLVYVNEIEVYRPFLIRSGQQEGLSFTNTSMISNVNFYAGGFQAKYGDKMSSVLDVTYRTPRQFALTAEASFLGGSLTADLVSKNRKWSAIAGVRYRNNALLVKTQEVDVDYNPKFLDFQTMINYHASAKWEWSFLGNISRNVYDYTPNYAQVNIGTIDKPLAVLINYDGQEQDTYQTLFGAVKSTYKANENNTFKLIASTYHTKEQEYYDIMGGYSIGEIDTDPNSSTYQQVLYPTGLATQLNHGRNDYDALIANLNLKGQHDINGHEIEWGIKYTAEDIRDRLVEWEMVDSAGFSIRPPFDEVVNNQPYDPFVGEIAPYQNVRATNFVKINRLSGFAQWSYRTSLGDNELWLNAGARVHHWQVDVENGKSSSQMVVSPRAQIALKPNWENTDMLFRLSGGIYYQPPGYRELRRFDGSINESVKAQQSAQIVLSNDYSFAIGETPFKLVSELYYKDMQDVNTYTLENVRIRYMADNLATAYVYGADFRLNAEVVPDTESWISFGYMKSEENYDGRGNIARPTDQRLKFGLMFQDYMPTIPNLKMYLNLVYNTGLPGGSPSYADPYLYQHRLNDYRRADVGFSYVFKDDKFGADKAWLNNLKELTLGFEIFNLFNNTNAITNTWVRDVYSKSMYGIPNRMTMRMFNLKVSARL
ncbi:MAG TPA: carboxypeptidase-like regulatory domain-containing protein [Flavobacterium sp.]|nr:carboxypeptidase-like regulatory domain-containing protein [Flavobacterium sp.]